MADQRLQLIAKLPGGTEKSIVLAVRHSAEWRSAYDASNDIGELLNSLIGGNADLELRYEVSRWPYADPEIEVEQ